MPEHDESLISAYLDHELCQEQSQQVENAIRDNPQFSRVYYELTQFKATFSRLRKEIATPDLSESIQVQISKQFRRRRIAPTLFIGSGLVSAAAVYLLLLSSTSFDHPGVAIPGIRHRLEDDQLPDLQADVGDPTLEDGGSMANEVIEAPTSTPDLDPELLGPPPISPQRSFVLDLLNRPDVQRVELVIADDTIDQMCQAVREILERTVRSDPRFAKLDLATSGEQSERTRNISENASEAAFVFVASDRELTNILTATRNVRPLEEIEEHRFDESHLGTLLAEVELEELAESQSAPSVRPVVVNPVAIREPSTSAEPPVATILPGSDLFAMENSNDLTPPFDPEVSETTALLSNGPNEPRSIDQPITVLLILKTKDAQPD